MCVWGGRGASGTLSILCIAVVVVVIIVGLSAIPLPLASCWTLSDPAPARAPDHTLAIAPIASRVPASREIVRRIVELFVFFSICNCYFFCIFYLFLLLHLQALRLHLQASREIVRRIVVLFNCFNFQLSFVLQLFFIFATAIAVGSRGKATMLFVRDGRLHLV